MAEFEIIDVHLHTYPTAEIGLQAMQGTGKAGYTGVIDELLGVMEEGGISKSVMLNLTPQAEMRDAALAKIPQDQQEEALPEITAKIIGRTIRRNQWTCDVAKEHPELIAYINLDPEMTARQMVEEIEDKVRNHGARGIKMHPANQRFYPADEPILPVYRTAQELNLPVLFHSGVFHGPAPYSRPSLFAEVLDEFPELNVVLAHIGHGHEGEAAELAAEYGNVSFDLSACISGAEDPLSLGDDEAVALIKRIGAEKIMFGSDYPWYDPIRDAQRVLALPLTDEEKRLILGENAKRILNL
jgi:hypothetical protein